MVKNTLIIALLLALIYLYYQQQQTKPNLATGTNSELAEIKSKLGEKTLDELLEANEDYETEVDTLTRTKNSLEQDLLAQSNAFQNRLREKDREVKKLKEDLTNEQKRADNTQTKLTSEKQQHKGSIERITKLTNQIQTLEQEQAELKKQLKKMPGKFPDKEWPPLSASKKDKK